MWELLGILGGGQHGGPELPEDRHPGGTFGRGVQFSLCNCLVAASQSAKLTMGPGVMLGTLPTVLPATGAGCSLCLSIKTRNILP